MALFDIQELTFSYPDASRQALCKISFQVQAGEYLCICGKSGCGKTTLLRHLKSVLTPFGETSGRVLFNGVQLSQVPEREQVSRIGFVMQNPDAQVVTDKVWHELAFGLESLGCDQSVMRLRVAEMASYFGIQDWFHRNVAELSGGQKQLLNLASIMAMQPDVLILDEPTSQLDPIAASDFLNTVKKINLELGTTIIITEHRLEDIYASADTVLAMSDGGIAAYGPPREVASALYASGDDMTFSLPSPVRIFYGVNEGFAQDASADECALTVREGRTWLSEYVESRPPDERGFPEVPFDDEVENPAVSLKEVWFRYERDAADVLRGVDLEIPAGCLHAIVGGNGTGKSTLLKSICGVVKPYRGKIRILGRPLKAWSEKELFHGGVAMLPQDPQNLFVKKTVRADLEEMLSPGDADREERIAEVVRMCDLGGFLDSHPYDLSGGEQQRAALAKVLLTKPKVLLLDEPTKGIDCFFKRELARVMRRLVEDGVSIIMVSHDVEFCARHADAISMFFDGSVVTTNLPRRFFSSNSFYTTAANRMSRHVFSNAITDEDVIELCLS